ncbi:MAG: tetratricopeptide repeat protein [Elusimicrobiota bacterium]
MLLLSISSISIAGLSKKITEGNKLFDEGSFDEALTKYNDAQIENPASPEIFFNMGTVYYRQKKYKEAVDAFQKSMEKGDVDLEAGALYNMGNSLFQQGQLKEALEYYKQSLERNPEDRDTKYNIEYTERKIKEMLLKAEETRQKAMQDQAQRKQEQQAGKGGKEDEGGEDKQQGSQIDQEKKDGEDKKDKESGESGENAGEKRDAARPEDKQEMSKDEAERFLSSFEQDQKNLTPPPQQGSERSRETHVEKDW